MPACRPVCGFTFPSTTEMSKQCLVFSSSHFSSIPHCSLTGACSLGGHRIHFVFDHPQIPSPTTYLLLHILPRPRGEKRGLLLPSLFASSSDVVEKTIGRQGEGRRKGFRPTCFIKCVGPQAWNNWLSSPHLVMVWPTLLHGLFSLAEDKMLQCHISIFSFFRHWLTVVLYNHLKQSNTVFSGNVASITNWKEKGPEYISLTFNAVNVEVTR